MLIKISIWQTITKKGELITSRHILNEETSLVFFRLRKTKELGWLEIEEQMKNNEMVNVIKFKKLKYKNYHINNIILIYHHIYIWLAIFEHYIN